MNFIMRLLAILDLAAGVAEEPAPDVNFDIDDLDFDDFDGE